jgi:predicted metal-binding membrane protein
MTSQAAVTYPLARERTIILGGLLGLAAVSWGVLVWQSQIMDEENMGLAMGISAPLFVALWAAMMVAIMFPTAAPMILTFAAVQKDRQTRGQAYVPTFLFVASYIALWASTGILAYGMAWVGDSLAERSMWVMDNAARIGGALLIVAGLYQLSPLKRLCLSKCRSPMGFVLTRWREGAAGAVRMGFEHGGYCLGCCWLLFLILFPLGLMNVAAMALIAVVIFAEKSLAIGVQVARVAALALVVYGIIVLFEPSALPTMV